MKERWDVRREEERLRKKGNKRGERGKRRKRDTSGWEALKNTEVKNAALNAEGNST